jgi:hypothetical protein
VELVDVALGVVLTGIGTIAATLAAFYWTGGGLTLLSFGLFTVGFWAAILLDADAVTALVGVSPRTRVHAAAILGYWFPVPGVMFAEQLRGAGWHSSLRRLWQVWIPLASIVPSTTRASSASRRKNGASRFTFRSRNSHTWTAGGILSSPRSNVRKAFIRPPED